jgi:hypothetical protein
MARGAVHQPAAKSALRTTACISIVRQYWNYMMMLFRRSLESRLSATLATLAGAAPPDLTGFFRQVEDGVAGEALARAAAQPAWPSIWTVQPADRRAIRSAGQSTGHADEVVEASLARL